MRISNYDPSILACLMLAGILLAMPGAYAESTATIDEIQGEVFVRSSEADDNSWNIVTTSTSVTIGDSVRTAEGTCSLTYGDRATLKLKKNTTVAVREDADFQNLLLLLGELNADINPQAEGKPFRIATPAAVCAVRGTNFDLSFDGNDQLTVDLHEGSLLVYNEEEEMEMLLKGGEKISLYYDYATATLWVGNSCDSCLVTETDESTGKIRCKTDETVSFDYRGQNYNVAACDEIRIEPDTASGELNYPTLDDYGDDPLLPLSGTAIE